MKQTACEREHDERDSRDRQTVERKSEVSWTDRLETVESIRE